jgi:hypothetical protein
VRRTPTGTRITFRARSPICPSTCGTWGGPTTSIEHELEELGVALPDES